MSESNGSLAYVEDRLLAAAQEGDRCAFERLYRHHHGALRAYCSKIVGDVGAAEDIVQETFLRVWNNLGSFDLQRRLWPWLQTIAQRLCIDYLRSNAKASKVRSLDEAIDHSNGTGGVDEGALDVQRELAGALGTLSPRYRRLLLLHALEDWSYQELARADGSSSTAVAKVLSRAKKRVRVILEQTGTCLGLAPGSLVGMRSWLRRARVRLTHPAMVNTASGTLALGESFGVAILGVAALGASLAGTSAHAVAPVRAVSPATIGAAAAEVQGIEAAPAAHSRVVEEPASASVSVRLDQGATRTRHVAPEETKLALEVKDLSGHRRVWTDTDVDCDGQGYQLMPKASPVQAVC